MHNYITRVSQLMKMSQFFCYRTGTPTHVTSP